MKIGVLMLRYPPRFESPVITGTIRLLNDWGAQVDVIYPEENLVKLSEVRPEHDLYVLKSRTEMSLAYAGILYGMGACTLNPYPAAAIMRHRISSASIMLKAGIPVPETVVTAHPEQLTGLLADGPLAIKLYRGTGVRGVHVVWDAEELEDVPTNQGPIFAQRFIPRPKHVRKLYMISGEIFGIEQGWPALDSEDKKGMPFTVTPKLRDITLRCADIFGVETFGLSIIGEGDDVYVVDINSFPDFKGVPDASLRLADFIYDSCRRVMRGEMLSGTLPTQRTS